MSAVRCSFGPVSDEQLAALVRQLLTSSFPLTNDLLERTAQSVIQRSAQDLGIDPGNLSRIRMLAVQEVRV